MDFGRGGVELWPGSVSLAEMDLNIQQGISDVQERCRWFQIFDQALCLCAVVRDVFGFGPAGWPKRLEERAGFGDSMGLF
jgi:hypothetical protein